MQDAKLLDLKHDICNRLMELGLSEESLNQIIFKAVMAHNSSVSIDPIGAANINAYNIGTRAIREELLPKGWVLDRTGNVESTVNPLTGVKIIYQNVDSAAERQREPRAISKKGSATNRIVEHTQLNFFAQWGEEFQTTQNSEVWFLCVCINGDNVRAELSCPSNITNKQFNGFKERIFLIVDDVWNRMNVYRENCPHNEADVLIEEDIEITISRK